ncbi:MAG: hypothetical protein ABR558_06855 [Thioalkalivibrio sp.]
MTNTDLDLSRRLARLEEGLLNLRGTAEALQLLPGSDTHMIQTGPVICLAATMAESAGYRIEELQELMELIQAKEISDAA